MGESRNTSQPLAGHTGPSLSRKQCGAGWRWCGGVGKEQAQHQLCSDQCLGSLPFVATVENSRSPSAEMSTCPGKVFLFLSPASPLDSLLVLPSLRSLSGNSMGTTLLLQDLNTQTLLCPASAFHPVGFDSSFSTTQHRALHSWVLAPG